MTIHIIPDGLVQENAMISVGGEDQAPPYGWALVQPRCLEILMFAV